ncbi:MAG: ribose-phosphate diphosphokinase [Candidatus Bathyarchaeia archaeon]
MIIVPGPASEQLGLRVAEQLGVGAVSVDYRRFPDGESYIRYTGSVAGEDVAVIQTTGPPQDTNLLQLFLLAKTAKDLGAKSVISVVPYLAYARQDKRFRDGEAISTKTIAGLIGAVCVDYFITLNIHNPEILNEFGVPSKNLSAIPLLAEFLKKKGLKGAFSLAPDEGALGMAKEADEVMGGGYGWLRKRRDRITGEIAVDRGAFDVGGMDAVVYDDIISTGGTMAAAVKILKDQGATRVYAACVHPLLVANADERILNSGAEDIVGTDCVPSPFSVVSVAPLIAKALRRVS